MSWEAVLKVGGWLVYACDNTFNAVRCGAAAILLSYAFWQLFLRFAVLLLCPLLPNSLFATAASTVAYSTAAVTMFDGDFPQSFNRGCNIATAATATASATSNTLLVIHVLVLLLLVLIQAFSLRRVFHMYFTSNFYYSLNPISDAAPVCASAELQHNHTESVIAATINKVNKIIRE